MKVFISYVKEDKEAAQKLFDHLSRIQEVEPWLDTESLKAGSYWRKAIDKAIRESDVFLALLSTKSVDKRGYFQKELKVAMEVVDLLPEDQIFLIPVRLDDCKVRDERLRNIHYVDLFHSWKDGLSRIMLAIQQESSTSSYNDVPSELEVYIARFVDISSFEKHDSWYDNFSAVVHEFDGDETRFIFWDENEKRLVKYYLSYGGVRWYGPEKLNETDIQKVWRKLRHQKYPLVENGYASLVLYEHDPSRRLAKMRFTITNLGPTRCSIREIRLICPIPIPDVNLVSIGRWPKGSVDDGDQKLPLLLPIDEPLQVFVHTENSDTRYSKEQFPDVLEMQITLSHIEKPLTVVLLKQSDGHQYRQEQILTSGSSETRPTRHS